MHGSINGGAITRLRVVYYFAGDKPRKFVYTD
jgi:hypothetical protein